MRAIAFAATIALAAPALAGETVSIAGSGQPLTIQITPSEDHEAEVLFTNNLTPVGVYIGPFILNFRGLDVIVDVHPQPGDMPDRLTVIPPTGYVAIPPEIIAQEGETVIVYIQRFAGM